MGGAIALDLYKSFIQNERQRKLVDLAGELADAFAKRGEIGRAHV